MTNFVGPAPSYLPTYQPSLGRIYILGEGNACFDMAAAIPGLKSVSGNHSVSIGTYCVTE